MRYFFHIGYNGIAYQGWQKLPQANSVQAVLEQHLAQVLKTTVPIVGCGRTDTRVHASQFFFHADIDVDWDYDLLFRVNKNLPPGIAVFDIVAVNPQAHARLHAVERTYTYFIHTRKDPYLDALSAPYPGRQFNLPEMKKAVALLPNYDNYAAFCRNPAVHRTTTCRVTAARLYHDPTGNRLRFELSANRFLNGMVRITMQKLLQVGAGTLTVAEFERQLGGARPEQGTKGAYPQGLYLSQVTYPFLKLPCRSALFNALVNDGCWIAV